MPFPEDLTPKGAFPWDIYTAYTLHGHGNKMQGITTVDLPVDILLWKIHNISVQCKCPFSCETFLSHTLHLNGVVFVSSALNFYIPDLSQGGGGSFPLDVHLVDTIARLVLDSL